MPHHRKPYLTREIRGSRTYWYFRRDKGPRIALPGAYGSPEFNAAYDAAIAGNPVQKAAGGAGTVAWLIARYMESAAWAALSDATRRQRGGILAKIQANAGMAPFEAIDRAAIVRGREARKDTPAAARHFVETMRSMFRWAVDAEIVKSDPTSDVKVPKKSTTGHHTWTPEEVALFVERWPLGTRERLAFDVLRYTGLRRSDAVVVGPQHVRDGVISLRTAKTGEIVYVTILPEFALSLAAGPTGDETFIAGERGKPFTKESFGNWFRKVRSATGLKHCSAHGIRKHVATSMAENGATVAHLESMLGWRGGGMASLYTRAADRARLAKAAMAFISTSTRANKDIE